MKTEQEDHAGTNKPRSKKYKEILMWILITGAIFLAVLIVIVLFWWAMTHRNNNSGNRSGSY
jgi:hypothetical protein